MCSGDSKSLSGQDRGRTGEHSKEGENLKKRKGENGSQILKKGSSPKAAGLGQRLYAQKCMP